MNDEAAIRVENLGKRFRIGGRQESYSTLRDSIVDAVSVPLRAIYTRSGRQRWRGTGSRDFVWALKEISFKVAHGEVLGIIGHNGAGKSTLLKILSRITEPTEGCAEIRGRVGSLLEVGSGFHYELTGRENIYLNGAILGMKRAEIDRKFDEIVAFAEVETFIDTPVKHYSSGMYLRLAFAVAAHLEPEILLVDEILAVGDIAFQKKCLGKIQDVAAHGRTVLFVSHNLAAVKELCTRSLILQRGRLAFHGSVVDGLTHYTRLISQREMSPTTDEAVWAHGRVFKSSNEAHTTLSAGDAFAVEAGLMLGETFANAQLFCIIYDCSGNVVVHQRIDCRERCFSLQAGRHQVRVEFPPLWLAPGLYSVELKFIGRKPSGTEARSLSQRMVLDVSGNREGISRALLAPNAEWAVSSAVPPAKTPEANRDCVFAIRSI